MKLYEQIKRLAENKKLALGDLKEDFVTEMWLQLKDVSESKLTDAFVFTAMLRQRYNKNNPIYKKLFKYYDVHTELTYEGAEEVEDDTF